MRRRTDLSQATLRRLFYWDGKLNRLRWAESSSRKIRYGDEAGSANYGNPNRPRYIVSIGAGRYSHARLVWIFHFGSVSPELFVRHKDGNGLNDDPENLYLSNCRNG